MPEDVNGAGGGMQTGVSGPFGGQGGVVGGANPNLNTNINPNPFNNINPGTGSAPITGFGSGSGDIILDNSNGKKKFRKWIAVILIVALIVLVVGVIVFLISNRKEKVQRSEIEKYVNYVVNGDTGDGEVGDEYSKTRRYYFSEILYNASEEEFESYYDELQDLLSKIEVTEGSELESLISEQKEILKMFRVYHKFEEYDEEKLMQIYMDGDYIGIENVIERELIDLKKSSVSYVNQYANDMDEFVDSVSRMMSIYDEAGCIGDTVDEVMECNLSGEYMIELSKPNAKPMEVYDEIDYVVKSTLRYYLEEVYVMDEYKNIDNMETNGNVKKE
ncbi:hypothetical protein IKG29_03535 [Candidatus Saccharibacteria bacterium]|nr:hypothetical protein [Candidatus Saccharibacteria bacterium]